MHRGQSIKLIVICSIIVTSLSLSGCVDDNGSNDGGIDDDWRYWPKIKSSVEEWSGYSSEQSEKVVGFNINENYIARVIIELTWEDEPSSYISGTNYPDSFNLTIFTPWQKVIHSDTSGNRLNGEGQILESIDIPPNDVANNTAVGEWSVTIRCLECGEDKSNPPIVRITEDSGNEWLLERYYEYHSNN